MRQIGRAGENSQIWVWAGESVAGRSDEEWWLFQQVLAAVESTAKTEWAEQLPGRVDDP